MDLRNKEKPLFYPTLNVSVRLADGKQIILIEISISYFIRVERFDRDLCLGDMAKEIEFLWKFEQKQNLALKRTEDRLS